MLNAHRLLLGLTVIALVAAGVCYYLLIYPLQSANAGAESEVAKLKQDLRVYGYPLYPQILTTLKVQFEHDKRDHYERLMKVYEQCTPVFRERLADFSSIAGFTHSTSTLDYQEEYTALKSRLEQKGINIDSETLGLSLNQISNQPYQLVAHLWVIEGLAKLAYQHRLDLRAQDAVTREDAGTGQKRTFVPARITAVPVTTYGAGSGEPFLEEYPVRLVLRGRVDDFAQFLQHLSGKGNFYVLRRCLVQKSGLSTIKSGTFDFQEIEATVTCSAFLILRGRDEIQAPAGSQGVRDNAPPWRPGS